MPADAQPALKEMFNAARYRQIADLLAKAYPAFDRKRFFALSTDGLAELSLLQRMRRTTEACRATLPADYRQALAVLRQIAPQLSHNFVSIFLADFVGQYGHDHFDDSMAALKFFTRFGSSEFAIREFLRRDQPRTLAVMTTWSRDPDEHVRRLASEGCRPRLPWSFRLTALVQNPEPVRQILTNLRNDPSLYVRKSVGNHLNDIAKDHPDWLFALIKTWDRAAPGTMWIIKRALRTLIKAGDQRALTVVGAGSPADIKISPITLSSRHIVIGESLEFAFTITPTAAKDQTLVVDYAIHYRKKSGQTAPKVFKLKVLKISPNETIRLVRKQRFENLSTRKLHLGRHEIEILINGRAWAKSSFLLATSKALKG